MSSEVQKCPYCDTPDDLQQQLSALEDQVRPMIAEGGVKVPAEARDRILTLRVAMMRKCECSGCQGGPDLGPRALPERPAPTTDSGRIVRYWNDADGECMEKELSDALLEADGLGETLVPDIMAFKALRDQIDDPSDLLDIKGIGPARHELLCNVLLGLAYPYGEEVSDDGAEDAVPAPEGAAPEGEAAPAEDREEEGEDGSEMLIEPPDTVPAEADPRRNQ